MSGRAKKVPILEVIFSKIFGRRIGKKINRNIGTHRFDRTIRIILGIVLFFLSFNIIYFFAKLGVDSHHTGIVVKNAFDVSDGKLLYRDSFTQYGWVQVVIASWFVKIFGRHVWAVLLPSAIAYAFIYVLVYTILSRYINTYCVFFLSFVMLFGSEFFVWEYHPWSNIYGSFFMLLCLWIHIRYNYSRSRIGAFGIAIASFLAFYTRLPIGVVLYIAIIMIFIYKRQCGLKIRIDNGIIFLFTTLILNLLTFLYFSIKGGLEEFVQQMFKNALSFGINRNAELEQAKVDNIVNSLTGGREYVTSLAGTDMMTPFLGNASEVLSTKLDILFSNNNNSVIRFLRGLLYDLYIFDYFDIHTVVWISTLCIIGFIICIFKAKKAKNLRKKYKSKKYRRAIYWERVKVVNLFTIIIFGLVSWSQYFPVSDRRHVTWGTITMTLAVSVLLYLLFGKWLMVVWRAHKKLANLIASVMVLLIVFFIYRPIIDGNVEAIVERTATNKYAVKNSEMFEGIRFQYKEALYYASFEAEYEKIRREYNNMPFLNYSKQNLFSCYDGFISIDGIYFLPDNQEDEYKKYYRENRVCILSDRKIDKGYFIYPLKGSGCDASTMGGWLPTTLYYKPD